MNILAELRKTAASLQRRREPIPLEVCGVGNIGHLTYEHGVYVNSAHRRSFGLMLRDEARLERAAREVSGGRFGSELANIARRISDRADVIRTVKNMRSAILSWDNILTAQSTGKSMDFSVQKNSVSITASVWIFTGLIGGYPAAAAPTNIPGGDQMTAASTGAVPLNGIRLGAGEHAYLTDFGFQVDGPNNVVSGIVGVVDLLVAAGNISATSAVSQNITTTALPRWTTGDNVAMSLVVTTNLGATAATITLSYTDEGGGIANSTGAISLTTSAITHRMQPTQDGPMIRLASPDNGVRVVEGCILSASMLAGVMAVILYKPLVFSVMLQGQAGMRTTPAQAGNMKRLTETAGGTLPFLSQIRFLNTGTVATNSLMTVCWG